MDGGGSRNRSPLTQPLGKSLDDVSAVFTGVKRPSADLATERTDDRAARAAAHRLTPSKRSSRAVASDRCITGTCGPDCRHLPAPPLSMRQQLSRCRSVSTDHAQSLKTDRLALAWVSET
jgi:hypothetical protein